MRKIHSFETKPRVPKPSRIGLAEVTFVVTQQEQIVYTLNIDILISQRTHNNNDSHCMLIVLLTRRRKCWLVNMNEVFLVPVTL